MDQRGEGGNDDNKLAEVVEWATVWLHAEGADQTALTLPVGRVIFLFEPIVHGFQRQVCLALRRRILVSVIQRHRQNVQEIFQIPTVQSDGTGARIPPQAVVQSEGLWEVFGVAF